MGDERPVFTNQAIYTSNNVKLINKGVRIDSSLFDKLVNHKLIPNLEECLIVENQLTTESLFNFARSVLESSGMVPFRSTPKAQDSLLRIFREITLVPAMAFKMTVMQSQHPELFIHSIRVGLIALHLAITSRCFSNKELNTLAASALFHDIGILHIPHNLLLPGKTLTEHERQYLYSHPITAYLLLNEYPEYQPDVSRIVFEHHEKNDGSGYPRNLVEGQICPGAQILALAETVCSYFENTITSFDFTRLSVLLRLNQTKYSRTLCVYMMDSLKEINIKEHSMDDEVTSFLNMPSLEKKLRDASEILHTWHEQSAYLMLNTEHTNLAQLNGIIGARLFQLQKTLSHSGIDLNDPTFCINAVEGDASSLHELNVLASETRWLLCEIIFEAERRLKDNPMPPEKNNPIQKWIDKSRTVLEML